MRRAGIAAAFCVLAAAGASAQDVYVDADVADVYDGPEYVDTLDDAVIDDDPVVDDDAVVVEETTVRERVIERRAPAPLGPRVYGWSADVRMEDCGTFKYWNGEYCADARYDPPETD